MSIEWRDPPVVHPEHGRRKPDDWQVPDELRARPGAWAIIKTALKSSTARSYRQSRVREWGPDFEIVVRGVEVYARYVGNMAPARGKGPTMNESEEEA